MLMERGKIKYICFPKELSYLLLFAFIQSRVIILSTRNNSLPPPHPPLVGTHKIAIRMSATTADNWLNSDSEEEGEGIIYEGYEEEEENVKVADKEENEREAEEGIGRGNWRGHGHARGVRGGSASSTMGANHADWREGVGIDVILPPFTSAVGRVRPRDPSYEPSHAIDLFITKDMINVITEQTNLHAVHIDARDWQPVTPGDIYAFLAIVIMMGLQQRPSEDDYWSDGHLGCPFVKRLLSTHRFKAIKRCLTMANPTVEEKAQDKLARVRPMVNLTRAIIRTRYLCHQNLLLNESKCQCGHGFSGFPYCSAAKKPITTYIKVISLHCAHCGYCIDFVVDTRTQTVDDMVLEVCNHLPAQPYRIVTNHFYNSLSTAKMLLEKRGLYMYGTVRTGRGADTQIKPTKDAPLADGGYRWSMAPPQLLSCVWRDTTPDGVWFFSTCHDGREPPGKVHCCKRDPSTSMKLAPQVAIDYFRFMGGCDRANSLRSSFNTHLTHKNRWYMSLFYYCIDLLLVDALIYHNDPLAQADHAREKGFRLLVADLFASRALLRTTNYARPASRKRHRFDELPKELRLPGPHLITKIDGEQKMCTWCYRTKLTAAGARCSSRTSFMCDLCSVPLHAECFKACHKACGVADEDAS